MKLLPVAVMWTVAVWIEGEREVEGVLPSAWVDKTTIRWPPKSAPVTKLFTVREPPAANWQSFSLVKVKFTSGTHRTVAVVVT